MSESATHPVPQARRIALRQAELWLPLKGVVAIVMERMNVDCEYAADLIASGLATGQIAHKPADPTNRSWIINPRGAELAQMQGFSYQDDVDWENGEVRHLFGSPTAAIVFWPDVERAARVPKHKATTEGQVATAAPEPQVQRSSGKGGRPQKYDWAGLHSDLAKHLYDYGCPAKGTGEQAELERWAAEWFPADRQPSESHIRDHVSKAIAARRRADSKA